MIYNVSNGTLNPTIPYHICHYMFEAENHKNIRNRQKAVQRHINNEDYRERQKVAPEGALLIFSITTIATT